MSRPWRIALILAVILLFMFSISLAWSAPQRPGDANFPTFSAKERQLIETYYSHIIGTLGPGSLDRSSLGPAIEAALAPGSHVPMQFEKDLQPLPPKLDLQLSQITGDYARYTLGRHVVLVRKADLATGDIFKDVAVALNK
jgi:hypothetical protein